MPPIESDKKKLKEADIDIKETLAGKLRARHFECLIKYLEDENFKETIKIIIDERNERADSAVKVNRKHTSVVAQVYRLQKELLNLEKSEIYQAGKWLFDALSLTGNALVKALLERDLLPKGYYNEAMTEVAELKDEYSQNNSASKKIIGQLQVKNDILRKKLVFLEKYIINKYGKKVWDQILSYMPNDNEDDNGGNKNV
jgi:hypothetical protein